MPDYRLYRLHPLSGRFIGVEEIHAADDESAIALSQQFAHGNAVEVWDGGRKVTQMKAPAGPETLAPDPERASLH